MSFVLFFLPLFFIAQLPAPHSFILGAAWIAAFVWVYRWLRSAP